MLKKILFSAVLVSLLPSPLSAQELLPEQISQMQSRAALWLLSSGQGAFPGLSGA